MIQPERLEEVKGALEMPGLEGIEKLALNQQDVRDVNIKYHGGNIEVNLIPISEIELIVNDKAVDTVIETIHNKAQDGKIGGFHVYMWSDTVSNSLMLNEEIME